jgi:hypothetical protein
MGTAWLACWLAQYLVRHHPSGGFSKIQIVKIQWSRIQIVKLLNSKTQSRQTTIAFSLFHPRQQLWRDKCQPSLAEAGNNRDQMH